MRRSAKLVFLFVFVIALMFAGSVGRERAHAEPPDADREMMLQKLTYSQNILAALVSKDFDQVTRNAKALNKLGEQKWLESTSPDYVMQNQLFWFTTGSLLLAAEQRNLDGATLAYTQMTVSCVNCHKLLRKQ